MMDVQNFVKLNTDSLVPKKELYAFQFAGMEFRFQRKLAMIKIKSQMMAVLNFAN